MIYEKYKSNVYGTDAVLEIIKLAKKENTII